jgi:hypothetical protein
VSHTLQGDVYIAEFARDKNLTAEQVRDLIARHHIPTYARAGRTYFDPVSLRAAILAAR